MIARCDDCPIEAGTRLCWARHAGCRPLCARQAADPRYRRKLAEMTAALGRADLPDLPPFALSGPADRVLIRSHLYAHGGYGQIAEWLGRGLESLGSAVAYESICEETQFLPLQGFVADRLLGRGGAAADPWELLLTVPHGAPADRRAAVFFTMWEVDRLRPGSATGLDRARMAVVPCRWNVEVLRSSGVRADLPIRVVPLGIDPSEGWAPAPIPADGPTVFATAGRLAHGGDRKGVASVVRAFKAAFPRGTPGADGVRLMVKVVEDDAAKLGDAAGRDGRIAVHSRALTAPEMADWSRRAHVGVFATCGEGWGLHLLQFMALGRPILAPMATAIPDYFEPSCGWPLGWRWTPARDFYGGYGARWAEPEFDAIVAAMRAAHADRAEVRRRGAVAAARAAEFTWGRTARELRAAMIEAGMVAPPPPDPIRPAAGGPPGGEMSDGEARAVAAAFGGGCCGGR